jgi:hypothetical protein
MDQIEGRHLISTSEMLTDKPQISLVRRFPDCIARGNNFNGLQKFKPSGLKAWIL